MHPFDKKHDQSLRKVQSKGEACVLIFQSRKKVDEFVNLFDKQGNGVLLTKLYIKHHVSKFKMGRIYVF